MIRLFPCIISYTPQASAECFDSCGNFLDPKLYQHAKLRFCHQLDIFSKERSQCLSMLSAERHRSLVKTVPTPGWSEPQLVDIQSTILSRVPSVSC